MKCLMKYQWVKLPRNHLPEGKGICVALISNAYNERSSELNCPGDLFFYLFFLEFVRILSGNTDALIKSAGSMSKASAIL